MGSDHTDGSQRKRRLGEAVFAAAALVALLVGVPLAAMAADGPPPAGVSVVLADVHGSANDLYPTGEPIPVLQGRVENDTPTAVGLAVTVTGGAISDVQVPTSAACAAWAAGAGKLQGTVAVAGGAPIPAGGALGGDWSAALAMAQDSPDACQGQFVTYTVTLYFSGGAPPQPPAVITTPTPGGTVATATATPSPSVTVTPTPTPFATATASATPTSTPTSEVRGIITGPNTGTGGPHDGEPIAALALLGVAGLLLAAGVTLLRRRRV